ncbi:MAG: hypothetical protein QXG00_01955 [Candidatus Woesearchaeota archaeon]
MDKKTDFNDIYPEIIKKKSYKNKFIKVSLLRIQKLKKKILEFDIRF